MHLGMILSAKPHTCIGFHQVSPYAIFPVWDPTLHLVVSAPICDGSSIFPVMLPKNTGASLSSMSPGRSPACWFPSVSCGSNRHPRPTTLGWKEVYFGVRFQRPGGQVGCWRPRRSGGPLSRPGGRDKAARESTLDKHLSGGQRPWGGCEGTC